MNKKRFWSVDTDDKPEYYCKLPIDVKPDENDGRPWRKFDISLIEGIDRDYATLYPQYLDIWRKVRPHFLNVANGKEKPVPLLAECLRHKEEIF